ncbi:unnamed protein product [Porites evermanni]|uniref:Uncharacterized protein n=1 Tax=Porites evermanni TaxID=104178 RepID=A0ABN8MDB0_9CNID|nr:unnamed protein product [Porites evermanni]
MFVGHTFERTLQRVVHSRLSPQFSGNGVQLFLSPDEAGSMIKNRDGENLRQTHIVTKMTISVIKTAINTGSVKTAKSTLLMRSLCYQPCVLTRRPFLSAGKKGLQLTACRCSRCYRIPD